MGVERQRQSHPAAARVAQHGVQRAERLDLVALHPAAQHRREMRRRQILTRRGRELPVAAGLLRDRLARDREA